MRLRQGRRTVGVSVRAIEQYGQVIDVPVSEKRDLAATRRFFTRALASRATTHQPSLPEPRSADASIVTTVTSASSVSGITPFKLRPSFHVRPIMIRKDGGKGSGWIRSWLRSQRR